MALTYQRKVEQLASALKRNDARPAAVEALRELVEAIVLTPDTVVGGLRIDLKGNLAALLKLANDGKKSEIGDIGPVLQQIAGARNHCYRTLRRGGPRLSTWS